MQGEPESRRAATPSPSALARALRITALGALIAANLYYWPRSGAILGNPPTSRSHLLAARTAEGRSRLPRPAEMAVKWHRLPDVTAGEISGVVTEAHLDHDTEVQCGQALIGINGVDHVRACDFPSYRAIGPGMTGPDVDQLVTVLQTRGIDVPHGLTAQAISSFLQSLGAPDMPFVDPTLLLWAPTGGDSRLESQAPLGTRVEAGQAIARHLPEIDRITLSTAPSKEDSAMTFSSDVLPTKAVDISSVSAIGTVPISMKLEEQLREALRSSTETDIATAPSGTVKIDGTLALQTPVSGVTVPAPALMAADAGRVCVAVVPNEHADLGSAKFVAVNVIEISGGSALISGAIVPGTFVYIGDGLVPDHSTC